jgi:beta-N-acetylhexosaminidase
VATRRLLGEKIFVRTSGTAPSNELLRDIKQGDVGGVVLFAENVGTRQQVRSFAKRVHRAGGLLAVDQEGGIVKRLQNGPPSRGAPQMTTRAIARGEGVATGDYLRGLGIDWDLAPVFDQPAVPGAFIRSRAFPSPQLAEQFALGLQSRDVAATAKHFPGLGYATTNTDNAPTTVRAQAGVFRVAHLRSVMMATAIYPQYDPGVPAALSQKIVTGVLRDQLGFKGVIVTDDLDTPAVRAYAKTRNAAVKAVEAGADVVLLVRTTSSSDKALASLLDAARSGAITRDQLEASHARIEALR